MAAHAEHHKNIRRHIELGAVDFVVDEQVGGDIDIGAVGVVDEQGFGCVHQGAALGIGSGHRFTIVAGVVDGRILRSGSSSGDGSVGNRRAGCGCGWGCGFGSHSGYPPFGRRKSARRRAILARPGNPNYNPAPDYIGNRLSRPAFAAPLTITPVLAIQRFDP